MTKPDAVVRRVRQELERGASPSYARRMQMFFKVPVRAYGWRTEEVRKLAAVVRRGVLEAGDDKVLLAVAEKLFAGPTLEEKTLGVALIEPRVEHLGAGDFLRQERWLKKVNNWAACDALCTAVLGRLLARNPRRVTRVFKWAKARNRWYRRAAAVALVPAARRGLYGKHIFRVSNLLLNDSDYMVQKGVGWLLREAAKVRRAEVVNYLLKVKKKAPRSVLRIACEVLPKRDRKRVLL